jgi:GntR family transcriptional regulator
MAESEPIALARGYWAGEIGQKLKSQDLSKVPLYETLETVFNISLSEAIESISAQTASADIASQIGVRLRSPLLVRQRTTYTSDMCPVEYTTTYYRADRYEYKVRLARHGA